MKSRKTDKGAEWCYYHLSYRRRLIRTLWCIPFAILVVAFNYWKFRSALITAILSVILAVIAVVQIVHNYRKWKQEEKDSDS
jgi:lipopolysaccharide export LptBFGC system permease protein LptF